MSSKPPTMLPGTPAPSVDDETPEARELREWAESLAASHPPLTDDQLDRIGTKLRDSAPGAVQRDAS